MLKRLFYFILLFTSFNKLAANEVLYFWSGAITPSSAKVNAVLKSPAEKVRLVVCLDKTFSQPIYSEFTSAKLEFGNTVALIIDHLESTRTYYYCLEIDGVKDLAEKHIGSFKTVTTSPYSFKFVAGSCNFFPNNKVYDKMRAQNPLFLLMPGDLHYANPSSSDLEPHRTAYEEKVLQHPKEAKFLQNIPIAYVWDDHDFCGDNNDGSTGCGIAAYKAYKEYIPYYPLGANEISQSIYQSFTIGRVHFIMTDLRSERKNGDIMSVDQKNWFKSEVMSAKNKGQIICWVSSVSFSGERSDNWGGYTQTRTELSNFFRDSNIVNMFIISGDAHMLAIDNGTHADFSDNKTNPNFYPILQSAALNNVGSDKGGIYSEGGTFPNPPFSSQWSTIEVMDNGGKDISIRFVCYRMNLFTKRTKVMTSYQFCRTLQPISGGMPRNSKPMAVELDETGNNINLGINYNGKAALKVLDYQGKILIHQLDVTINNSLMLDISSLAKTQNYYVVIETKEDNYISQLNLIR